MNANVMEELKRLVSRDIYTFTQLCRQETRSLEEEKEIEMLAHRVKLAKQIIGMLEEDLK